MTFLATTLIFANIFTRIWDSIKNGFQKTMNLLSDITHKIVDWIFSAFGKFWEWIEDKFNGLWDGYQSQVNDWIDQLKNSDNIPFLPEGVTFIDQFVNVTAITSAWGMMLGITLSVVSFKFLIKFIPGIG